MVNPARSGELNRAQGVGLVNQTPLPDAGGIREGERAAPRFTPLLLVRPGIEPSRTKNRKAVQF